MHFLTFFCLCVPWYVFQRDLRMLSFSTVAIRSCEGRLCNVSYLRCTRVSKCVFAWTYGKEGLNQPQFSVQ